MEQKMISMSMAGLPAIRLNLAFEWKAGKDGEATSSLYTIDRRI